MRGLGERAAGAQKVCTSCGALERPRAARPTRTLDCIMRGLAVFAALLITDTAAAQQSVFELKASPGEGRPVLIAKHAQLELHASPDLQSASATLSYRAGWKIPFLESLLRTLKAAEVRTVGGGSIEVWCEGSGLQQLTVSPGESWTYLQYAAEGFVTARIQGRVCQLPAYTEESIFGADLLQPDVQWWIRVAHADGTSPGWLLVTDEQVLYGKRQF